MQNPPAYPNQAPYQPGPPMQQQPKKGFPIWAILLLAFVGLVVVLGVVLVVLGIYGTRKYLAAAKSAEAKSTISAISRDALAAYEREPLDPIETGKPGTHRLCGSAHPVPATLVSVKGVKYMPSSAPGADFESGDPENGWRCLKFEMTMPMYYRYQYNKGSGYVAPSVAPGANGFEASAQGDLNGDGTPSTFAMVGKVGPTGALALSPSIFIENEAE